MSLRVHEETHVHQTLRAAAQDPARLAAVASSLAQLIDLSGKNAVATLPHADRRKLLDALAQLAASDDPGVLGLLTRVATSAAKKASASEIATSRRAAEMAGAFLARKKDRGLTSMTRGHLLAASDRLPAAVRAAIPPPGGGYSKVAPPYEAVKGADGVYRFDEVIQCQDEFYPAWRKMFDGHPSWQLVDVRGKERVYRRVADVNGRRTEFTVRLFERHRDMWRHMSNNKTDIVMQCSHSDWWARVGRDLMKAPAQKGEKIYIGALCFGDDFLPDVLSQYPDIHPITSKNPTEDVEDRAAFELLHQCLARGDDWATFGRLLRAHKDNPDDNFVDPSMLDELPNLDVDRDGIADVHETTYNPPAAATPDRGIRSDDWQPSAGPFDATQRPDVDGSKVVTAVQLLNSVSYDHQLLDMVNLEQRVVAGGFFAPAPGDKRVVDLEERVMHGKKVLRLRVSQAYAHAHPAALTALVLFEGTLALLDRLPAGRLSEASKVLLALATMAHVSENDVPGANATVYRRTLEHYGLPLLDRDEVLNAVAANKHWESGSYKTVRELERLMKADQRRIVERWRRP
jgi:hypothetical protein